MNKKRRFIVWYDIPSFCDLTLGFKPDHGLVDRVVGFSIQVEATCWLLFKTLDTIYFFADRDRIVSLRCELVMVRLLYSVELRGIVKTLDTIYFCDREQDSDL